MIGTRTLIILCGLLLFSCTTEQKQSAGYKKTEAALGEQVPTDVVLREIPLPEIPISLTDPEERAAYLLEHFWDKMDIRDTLSCHNRVFMEQNMVNFMSLFPHARSETLPKAIGLLWQLVFADSTLFNMVRDITGQYLAAPNSPMRNEEYYILFLEELLKVHGLSELESTRCQYRLEQAKKNRPGTVATDFVFLTRNGKRQQMHSMRTEKLLLLFYDPACAHCTDILNGLQTSTLLQSLITSGKLDVLAIYTEGDRSLWDKTKNSLPKDWMVGIDQSGIVENGLYSLQAMPILYLLDKNKVVILKDPSLSTLKEYLTDRL